MLRILISTTVIMATLQPVLASPLTEAAAAGKLREVKRLLKAGAAVNELDSDGEFALDLAIWKGHAAVAHNLLQEATDLDLNMQDREYGYSALMAAAEYGQPGIGFELIKKGAKLDLQCDGGWTALMIAARHGQPELGLEVVRRGAKLDLQNGGGWTALMIAARYGQPELALEVVRKGAELDLQNGKGWTALMIAARRGQPELGLELLQRGANFRKRERTGSNALHVCAQNGEVHLAEAILDLGEDVDSRDFSGRTALWWASLLGKKRMVRVLLRRGANAAIPASWGQTAEAVADSQGLKDLLHQAMPGQLGLMFRLACLPDTWLHMGLGLLMGVAGAICHHFSTSRGFCRLSVEQDEDRPSKGAMKLAHQAFAKRNKLRYYAAMAFHAGTSISVVVLPLGVAMLFFKPAAMVPVYALVYVTTAVTCVSFRQLIRSPVLVITGASAQGVARAIQAISTLALLIGVATVHQECEDDIQYHIVGDSKHETPGKLAHVMVKWGQLSLLNDAAAPLACGESLFEPFAAATRHGFDAYTLAVKMTAFLWAPVALVEACSCKRFKVVPPEDREEVANLAAQIGATCSAGEVKSLECDVPGVKVAPERHWCIYFTVFMSLFDMFVMDVVTIFNLVMTYNTKFAGTLTAITVMSTCSELVSGNLRRLPGDVKEAVNRGVMPDSLMDFLSVEKGLEAPLSLVVTVYSFPFSVRGWPSFCTGLLSMALSICCCAQYEIDVEDEHEAATTKSEEETSSLTTSSSE